MKKVSILARTVLLLGLVLFLARCGSSSSGGDLPMWMFNTRLSAIRLSITPTRPLIIINPITGTDTRVLTWFCGNYQGNQRQTKLY